MKCRKCGRDSPDLNEDGLCPDCSLEDEDFINNIIFSPFNPGL